jgi:hypothetical protein
MHEVLQEHRRLDALFEDARTALASGLAGNAPARALARLRVALEAHFGQEDRLYYPPIRALRPEHRPVIDELRDGHDVFRRRVAAIVEQVARGAVAEAAVAFDVFTDAFVRHEAREEALLRGLEDEAAA